MATTKAALENLVRDGEAADVTVHGQLSRKRLLSRGLIFGDLLLSDNTLLNFMVRAMDGWLTKEQVVALKFAMHLGDMVAARGRLERSADSNELLFVLVECATTVSWDSLHPGTPYTCDQSTFFTSADNGSSQTNMVQLQGMNACKYYFNNASCVRGHACQFFHGKPEEYNDLRKEWLAKRLQLKRAVSAIPGDQHDPNEKKLKSARAKLFTEWLVATFGKALLRQGSGVLDVAGGRGDIAYELWITHNVPCTLVEPRMRKPRKEHFKALAANPRLTLPPQIQACLDASTMATHGQTLAQASLVVGMHPDEATEAIVDMALSMQKPFAVVPCCVMSRQFPHRRLDGDLVATYNVFVKYLRRKHPQIQATFLPFAGKNQVLYMLPTHYPCT
ncbi:hypothetical protein H310_13402 [Aphanomyces invadans]|uniref:C3H1-type domain-containing protein n=1 Tax=Aphanomyces invadans TaxID=157072 RepID=A0A024TDQ8_9STRA|nr:hypothetical protein H310_13402 [Aphanomyces invadans]ETV92149.1 hypothetical protein H310_13402 [Aphanomyces invadans]|eukprot:XP_008879113.1 hypothetical protein H310_13402 [Aphanomyces invadans]